MRRVLILILTLNAYLATSQNAATEITLNLKNKPLETILDSVSQISNFYFSYNSSIIPRGKVFTVEAEEQLLPSFLNDLLFGTGLIYTFSNDQIVLKREADIKDINGLTNFSLYGWARDAEDGKYIPGVNVYLDGTSIGTVTNVNGYYKFDNIPLGAYTLVFSHVSYETFSLEFTVREEGSAAVNGNLDLKLNELQGVEVRSTRWLPIDREEESAAYRIFEEEFLGKTYNSNDCKILNREVLSFYSDDKEDTLFAEASEPLRIRNEALGYMIIYELEYFKNYADGISYTGNVRFEQLPVMSRSKRKKWKKNRKRAFYGSMRHFSKSLIDGNMVKEGFRAFLTDELTFIGADNELYLRSSDLVSKSNTGLWELYFDGYLFVEYAKEKESDLYVEHKTKEIKQKTILTGDNIFFISRKPSEQRSLIKITGSSVEVDANGHIQQPLAISTVGYWAWERFADLLPIDYDPKIDKIR